MKYEQEVCIVFAIFIVFFLSWTIDNNIILQNQGKEKKVVQEQKLWFSIMEA